jgi:hypothetical protein
MLIRGEPVAQLFVMAAAARRIPQVRAEAVTEL